MLQIKSFVFNPFQENTYVVYNQNKQCLIIDPGCYYDDEKQELSDFIEKEGLVPSMLINTHCHLDHIFGNAYVAAKYALPLTMHKAEDEVLDMAPAAGLMYNVPFDNYSGQRKYVEAGNEIGCEGMFFKVLFTPGHSPGSISFYHEEMGWLISGDVLFRQSIGRTDLPGGHTATLIQSIKNQLFKLPKPTRVFSGHGPETTIGEEMHHNPFLQGQGFDFS